MIDSRQDDDRRHVHERELVRARVVLKIQIGSVCMPGPAVKFVTMISSNDRAKASRAPAISAVRMRRERHPPEGQEGVRAEVGRGLLERARRPPQPGDRVVVDDHDAERGVADDDREQPERDADVRNAVLRAMPVTMPGRASGRITMNEIASRPKNV